VRRRRRLGRAAERERDDARADAERLASARDELESKLEVVTAESRAADSRSTALAAATSERDRCDRRSRRRNGEIARIGD
jgi:hypothetical protein